MELIVYREKNPLGNGASYCEIEERKSPFGVGIYSRLVVINGCTWEIDPMTVKNHDSLDAAAASFGLKFADFEECDRQEYVY